MYNVLFGSAEQLTVISYRKRKLVMYPVQKTEFDILSSGYNSIHLGLAAGCFGAAVTLATTIASVSLPEPMGTRFWVSLLILVLATIRFGFIARREYRASQELIAAIKSETVDVVIGAEVKPQPPPQ